MRSAKLALRDRCGQASHQVHQNHRYLVKDLPISGQAVYLEVNRRQFKCKNCGKPFSEELDFVAKRRQYTSRLAREIVRQVLADDIKTVAENNDVSMEEIETMLKDYGSKLKLEKPSGLKKLGIDKIALVKGQGNYCAVLIDIEQSKVIAILEERTQEKIMETLCLWGEEVLNGIEFVSIELGQPYKSLVEKLMPNATVVADRFHVMKQINEELDQQRKTEKSAPPAPRKPRRKDGARRAAQKEKSKKKREKILLGLAKSKYALLKNKSNLNEKQQAKLEEVSKVCPTLGTMHELKEKFRDIFEKSQDGITGLLKISDWLKEAVNYYPESNKTIRRWIGEIIAYFDERITNGVVEEINNKIKLIKRSAYGFRNFENFRTRVLLSWHFNY